MLFGYALPTTGHARDFYLLDFAHAGHTKKALLSITDNSAFSAKRSLLLCRMQITLLSEQWPVARRTVLRPYDPSRRTTK